MKEKLAPDLTNIASEATVIINTIPNVSPEKIETHMTLVKQFIQGREGQPIDGLLDRENRRGSVIARVKGQVLSELANESSVVLSIYRVPKVILSAVKKRKQELKQNRSQMIVASSLDVQDTPPSPSDKYEVVEIDSGVKMIQEFQSHVTPLSALPRYADGEDKDDHGTPIASLILFGEGARASKTRLRVTSYKGWQNSGPYPVEDLYTAFKYVLDNYHGKSRVFVSSLNYEFHDDFSEQETRKLELLLQSKNICFVNSAGNICDAIPRRHAHESRESIWKSSKVFHPSDARTVISVGACCRENNLFDHSFNFYPACFSRHSSDKIANKPEVLEYGGTHEVEGFANHDKGVLAHSITGTPKSQFGTSMAAPLFARHLALLDWSLGSRVKNCETLQALAYSACKMTSGFDDYCGFGVLDPDELSVTRDTSVRVIFEGRFENMSEDRIPVHELNIPIPAQPVKVTLYLVHSDNYSLNTMLDNYTAIMVDGTKGQQKLQLVKEKGVNIGKWTHVKKAVYSYKKNSIGWWRFRLKPKLDNIPIQELPKLSMRYGGVLVISSPKLPPGYNSLREAIEKERERSRIAVESMNSPLWDEYD